MSTTNLLWKSWRLFLYYDLFLARGKFKDLYQRVSNWPVSKRPETSERDVIRSVTRAVDLATVWYPVRSLCLKRASTLTCLLRDCGIPARMVIGARPIPFTSHAWVEVEGEIINDRADIPYTYQPIAEC